jgi:putative PIG3 family NAD(P)H quinone oxidoreductase
MRAITVPEPGGPDVLTWAEVPDPECGPGEVLIDVVASAVNRADLLQRQGHYPPPPGASDVLGLECSGIVREVGEGVAEWSRGDEVCALLAGGGYAERVAVPAGQVLPKPAGVELATAAALPEVTCTVWSNVFMTARLRHGERFLVHGGAGGIGTMAIQLAARAGAQVFATAGSAAKLDLCRELGAHTAIDYREEDFVEVVRAAGGADVVLDNMGAKYLARNLAALNPDGRLVIIGMQGGTKTEIDLGRMLSRRQTLFTTTLRSRPPAGPTGKAAIVTAVRHDVWPDVERGTVRPIVSRRLPMADAAEAHRLVEASEHTGKVLLVTGD